MSIVAHCYDRTGALLMICELGYLWTAMSCPAVHRFELVSR